jgi:hypothetical protein
MPAASVRTTASKRDLSDSAAGQKRGGIKITQARLKHIFLKGLFRVITGPPVRIILGKFMTGVNLRGVLIVFDHPAVMQR